MIRRTLGLVLCLALSGPALAADKTTDVERLLERYETPERGDWQRPGTVMRLLALEPGDKVADLGTGTGYFLPRLSMSVGNTGMVYAVDIDKDLLDFVKTREGMKAENIVTILAEDDDPKLPEDALDVVLIVNTWHHIKGRVKYLKKVAAGLNPWGHVVLIDFREGDLPVGPSAGEKVSREDAIKEFTRAGWTLGAESVALPYQYYLVFSPPSGT
jgi:ubiquinone/menaquinone biosynthesis C-methylase UbiE